MNYTMCLYCGKEFHSLGIMRHRVACIEKQRKEKDLTNFEKEVKESVNS